MKKALLTLTLATALIGGAAMAHDHKDGEGKRGKFQERMFQKIDADGDGSITKAEFTAFGDQKFSEMDADKDGKVTREESTAYHAKKREEWKARKAAEDSTGK